MNVIMLFVRIPPIKHFYLHSHTILITALHVNKADCFERIRCSDNPWTFSFDCAGELVTRSLRIYEWVTEDLP